MPGKNALSLACASGVVSLCAVQGAALASYSFDDIEHWTGAGANRAALVIDWNDGKGAESIAWGYRFDGAVTAEQMLESIVRADGRLFAAMASLSFGDIAIGLGYDADGDGFGTSPATPFDTDGWAWVAPRDGTAPTDADDHYVEGWNTGYWAYYIAGDSPFGGSGAWGYADNGIGAQVLGDGEWHGLSFAPGFEGPTPDEPVSAAVPAPGALVVCTGMVGVLARRRR